MIALLEAEICNWAGVTWRVEFGGKHPRLYVTYKGRSRFIPFTKTSTDPRGMRNKVSQLKRELLHLGARRG